MLAIQTPFSVHGQMIIGMERRNEIPVKNHEKKKAGLLYALCYDLL